jgi:transcriptional regulator with XRE-family HTH domain
MRLRQIRRRKAFSAADLGAKADLSMGTIYAIEHGRELPTLGTARRLAQALDVDPLEIDEFRAALERLGEEVEAPGD